MIPGNLRPAPARSRERDHRRQTIRNRVCVGLALLIAFGVGVALGQALHDNPRPGGLQTRLRTLPPLTQPTLP